MIKNIAIKIAFEFLLVTLVNIVGVFALPEEYEYILQTYICVYTTYNVKVASSCSKMSSVYFL